MELREHVVLSDFIKNVHKQLRHKCKLVGAEKAWENHLSDGNNLKQYALAMKELATNHWERNQKDITRIIWTCNICNDYFNQDIIHLRKKETDIAEKIGLTLQHCPQETMKKWKLLDVGSCYNPFKKFDCFDVTALDIAPATSEVIHCDFLGVDIGKTSVYDNNKLTQISQCSYDIVVFSLFLEYLPSPAQRKHCCEKAYKLLKTEGLLIIITPDSNHIGSNAKIIKSWQFVLAEIGFLRIKYEKLSHVHCMAFRKAFSREIPVRWAELHRNKQVFDQIYIPQDFASEPKEKIDKKTNLTTDEIVEFNEELPSCDIFR